MNLIFQIGTPIIVIAIFAYIIRRSKQSDKMNKEKAEAGIAAQAKILGIENKSNNNSGKAQVIYLTLEVTPPNGPAYVVTTKWIVEVLHFPKIQEGNMISVKIDAEDSQMIYPDVIWATSGRI